MFPVFPWFLVLCLTMQFFSQTIYIISNVRSHYVLIFQQTNTINRLIVSCLTMLPCPSVWGTWWGGGVCVHVVAEIWWSASRGGTWFPASGWRHVHPSSPSFVDPASQWLKDRSCYISRGYFRLFLLCCSSKAMSEKRGCYIISQGYFHYLCKTPPSTPTHELRREGKTSLQCLLKDYNLYIITESTTIPIDLNDRAGKLKPT